MQALAVDVEELSNMKFVFSFFQQQNKHIKQRWKNFTTLIVDVFLKFAGFPCTFFLQSKY